MPSLWASDRFTACERADDWQGLPTLWKPSSRQGSRSSGIRRSHHMYCAVFSIHYSRCHLLHLHGVGSVLFWLRSPRLVCRTMALELTNEQRSKVISLIKRHISEHGNCRVGWALRQVAGEKFENSIHNKEKIANRIIQSGEYIKEESAQAEKDWNIDRKS